MKFALANDERREAEPGLIGVCCSCGSPVVARCGTQRVWHWAHRSRRSCDNWWEPETDWHRRWKNQFPKEWQEVTRHDEKGERHIADVRTETDFVIEFQHSYLDPKERIAREAFYGDMVWVVDGARLKRDWPRFEKAARRHTLLEGGLFSSWSPGEYFPSSWLLSDKLVFFDFLGSEAQPERATGSRAWLWVLGPKKVGKPRLIASMNRNLFVEKGITGDLSDEFSLMEAAYKNWQIRKTGEVASFRQKNLRRSRF